MRQVMIGGVAALFLAGGAMAADYESPVDLPAGSQIDFVIQRTRSGSAAPPMTITFHYRQEITPRDDGYSVRQHANRLDYPPGMPEAERRQLEALSAASAEMTYDADESLTPLRIQDWQAMVDRMADAGSTPETRTVAEGVRRLYSAMSPETAANALMREHRMVAASQGTSLDLKRPVSEKTQAANPLGGPPIDGVYRIELESLDKASGRAVIRVRSTLDPESATRSVAHSLEAMGRAMPRAPKPTAEQIAAIKIERTLECAYEMDIVTGLATRTDCTQTVSSTDENLKPRVQVDRWLITQTLVRPD